jgi:Ca2+-binding EF-hand superfamily protein
LEYTVMKKQTIKYFAEGAANAAARANQEKREAVWAGLARPGLTAEDSVTVLRQKRLAVHLAAAVIVVQLLSLMTWSNDIAIAVFGITLAFASACAFVWFALNKDPSSLRWLLVASGLFYSGAFFVSESCTPLVQSGGRLFAMIVPTLLFHLPCGGGLFGSIVAPAGHFMLFVFYAILESSLSAPCFSRRSPTTTDSIATIFLQIILPWCVTCVCAVTTYHEMATETAEREDAEAFAAKVLANLDAGAFSEAASQSSAFVADGGFVPTAVDLALQQALMHANNFHASGVIPGVVSHTPEARSPKNGNGPQLPGFPMKTPPLMPGQTAGGPPKSPPLLSTSAGNSTEVLLTPGVNRQASGTRGAFVAFTENAEEGRQASFSVPSKDHSRRGSEIGSVTPRNLDGSAIAVNHGDGEVAAPGSFIRRRRSTTAMSRHGSVRHVFPMKRSRQFIVNFSLPRLAVYLDNARSEPEMARLILSQYKENITRVCNVFTGTLLFVSFTDVYVTFETCSGAAAASVYLLELMVKDNAHHLDPLVQQCLPFEVMAVIVNAELVCGLIGTDPSSANQLGWSSAEPVLAKIKHYFALTTLSPPIVLVANTLVHLIEGDFAMEKSHVGHFTIIERALERDAAGLPRLTHSRPREAEIDYDVAYDLPDVDIMIQRMVGGLQNDASGENSSGGTPTGAFPDGMGASMAHTGVSPEELSFRGKSAHGRRKRLSPEVVQLWRKFDADNNGHLDVEEIKEVLDELGIMMTESEFRVFFDEVDRDGNGTVNQEEFAKAFFTSNLGGAHVISGIRKAAASMKLTTGVDQLPIVMSAWRKYDADGSGSLEAEELAKVLSDLGITQSIEEVEWLVQKLDANGNGQVDFEEFAALFSEDVTELKGNIVKQRIEIVARVMENKAAQEVFSTPSQTQRDNLVALRHKIETYFSPILFLYIIYNFGVQTYRCSMGLEYPTHTPEVIADMSLDVIYISWFVMKLAVMPREVGGHILYLRKDALKDYVKSVDFWVDLITVLPIDFFYIGIDNPAVSGTYGYYRLNKLVAMYHLDWLFTLSARKVNPVMFRILNAMLGYVVVSHLFACALLIVTRIIGEGYMDNMTGTQTLISDAVTRYLMASLWAYQTLAGQIRGDAIPITDEQVALLLVACLVSLPIFASLLAVIGNAVNVETAESNFLSRVDSLRSYFSYARGRMPDGEAEALEVECIRYYRHLFETTGSLDITANPLNDVPAELLIQVTVETGLEMLRKVPIFKEASENVELFTR